MSGIRFALASAMLAASAVHAAPQVDVIAKGLNNPRGLDFAPNGQLYVAEAGSGGNGRCLVQADNRTACYGETGAITRVDPRGKRPPLRVIAGLPSLAQQPSGFGGGGPQNISFLGAGNAKVVMGLGAEASARTGVGPKSSLFGKVLQVRIHGNWKKGDMAAYDLDDDLATGDTEASARAGVGPKSALFGQEWQVGIHGSWKLGADIAAYELANNPVPGGADSNPFGVATLPGRYLVADAGANALFSVRDHNKVSTLATFPARLVAAPPFLGLPPGAKIPMQSVPTTVIDGKDGWLYISELTGFPFPVGGANVYRVSPHGGAVQLYASGFTNVVALAFDAWHRLYVLEIGNGPSGGSPPLNGPGRLLRVNADGSRTVIYDKLFYPGGLAIGADGAAYVTNNGIVPGPIPGGPFADGGTVLRISLD